MTGENLGEMHHANRFLLSPQQAIEVHQAGHIPSGDDLSPGLLVVVDAVVPHHAGDGLFTDSERPSEAAAFIGPQQVDQFQSLYQLQQLPSLAEGGQHAFG